MRTLIELPPAPDPDPYTDPLALAVVKEVVERGEAASEAGVIAKAGVSMADFSERYATIEDCAVEAYERFIAAFERQIGGAFNAHPDWRTSLRAAAHEAADFVEGNPELNEFGLTGVLRLKSERGRLLREEIFVFCADLIDLGRTESGSPTTVDRSAATYAIGSIVQLLTHWLQAGVDFDPYEVVPEMMYSVVRVYLGDEAAEEELSLPRPPRP
jgi:hypothetical protein